MSDGDKSNSDALNDAQMLDEAREAMVDSAVQRLRFLYELKRTEPASSYGEARPPRPTTEQTSLQDMLFDLTRLSVHSYNQWLKITNRHFDGIVDQLRGITGARTRDPARIVLNVSATLGAPVESQEFCIQNPFTSPMDVSFSNPLFCPAVQEESDKGLFPAPAAKVKYLLQSSVPPKPRRPGECISLLPDEEAKLTVKLTFRGPFEKKRCYTGDAYILCRGRASGVVKVNVEIAP